MKTFLVDPAIVFVTASDSADTLSDYQRHTAIALGKFEQSVGRLLDTLDFMASVEGDYWVPNLAMRIDFNNVYAKKKSQ
jgi:hypothetical protein